MTPQLSDLTIVVPTYKRHASLAKLLAYYAPLPVQLIVVDGSAEPYDLAGAPAGAMTLRYFHMPVSIDERIAFAAEQCSTPYTMFSCDDEYYLPQGLLAALAQLAADPGQSASAGRVAAFVYGQEGMQLGTFYNFLKGHAAGSALATERLQDLAANPALLSGFYYSVCRTAAFRGAVRVAFGQRYACPFVQEVLFSLCLYIQGPMRTVPELLWLRNLQAPPVHEVGWNRKLDFSAWWNDPAYAGEVAQMRDSADALYQQHLAAHELPRTLDGFFDNLVAHDHRAAAGELEADKAYPFAVNAFLLLSRERGLPVDEAGLLAAERTELAPLLAADEMTQLKARITTW